MIHARRFIIIVIIIVIIIFIIINVIVIIMPSLWHHHYHHCHHHSYKFKKINTFLPCILCAFWLFLFWANNNIIIYRMKIMWTVEIQIVNARYDCCRTSTGFEPMASALALQCSTIELWRPILVALVKRMRSYGFSGLYAHILMAKENISLGLSVRLDCCRPQ